jgi:outer membrane lipoprotein SlyB
VSRFWGSRTMLAGIAGAILGGAAETWINRTSGTMVVRDGLMWGAVVGVLFASLPNFTRMGYLTVKSDKPAINFVVGVGMFLVISLVGSAVFLGIFWLITRLLS